VLSAREFANVTVAIGLLLMCFAIAIYIQDGRFADIELVVGIVGVLSGGIWHSAQ
jgi:hypothetical protein